MFHLHVWESVANNLIYSDLIQIIYISSHCRNRRFGNSGFGTVYYCPAVKINL